MRAKLSDEDPKTLPTPENIMPAYLYLMGRWRIAYEWSKYWCTRLKCVTQEEVPFFYISNWSLVICNMISKFRKGCLFNFCGYWCPTPFLKHMPWRTWATSLYNPLKMVWLACWLTNSRFQKNMESSLKPVLWRNFKHWKMAPHWNSFDQFVFAHTDLNFEHSYHYVTVILLRMMNNIKQEKLCLSHQNWGQPTLSMPSAKWWTDDCSRCTWIYPSACTEIIEWIIITSTTLIKWISQVENLTWLAKYFKSYFKLF